MAPLDAARKVVSALSPSLHRRGISVTAWGRKATSPHRLRWRPPLSTLPPSISAVLPAYDEVAVIAGVVRRTHAALAASGVARHEVIVVDDGSNDGTGDAVRALDRELPQTRLLTHPQNLGYGAA